MNIVYNIKNIVPSILLMFHWLLMKYRSKILINIINGAVQSNVVLNIEIGAINPETPIIRKIFAIFEPITFPTAMFPYPFNAADTETKSSGSDVPIAIKLNPIIFSGIFSRLAKKIASYPPYNLPIEDWYKEKPEDRAEKVLNWLESHEGDHWWTGDLDVIQMSVWLLYEEGSELDIEDNCVW